MQVEAGGARWISAQHAACVRARRRSEQDGGQSKTEVRARRRSEQDGGQSKMEDTCQRKAKWSGMEARQTPGPMRDIISAPPARPQPCGVPPHCISNLHPRSTRSAHRRRRDAPTQDAPRCPAARLRCRTPLELPPLP